MQGGDYTTRELSCSPSIFSFPSAFSVSSSLDKIKSEILDLTDKVADSVITPARQSIEELQRDLAKLELAKLAKLPDLPSLPSPHILKVITWLLSLTDLLFWSFGLFSDVLISQAEESNNS